MHVQCICVPSFYRLVLICEASLFLIHLLDCGPVFLSNELIWKRLHWHDYPTVVLLMWPVNTFPMVPYDRESSNYFSNELCDVINKKKLIKVLGKEIQIHSFSLHLVLVNLCDNLLGINAGYCASDRASNVFRVGLCWSERARTNCSHLQSITLSNRLWHQICVRRELQFWRTGLFVSCVAYYSAWHEVSLNSKNLGGLEWLKIFFFFAIVNALQFEIADAPALLISSVFKILFVILLPTDFSFKSYTLLKKKKGNNCIGPKIKM